MLKDNKVDYKLVNLAIIALILYLMYHTGHLWIGIFNKTVSICMPFIIGFAASYALNPIVIKLQKKNIPRGLAILIVIMLVLALVIFTGYVISTTCVSQLSTFLDSINTFVSDLSKLDMNINISGLQETISSNSKELLNGITKYVSDGAINLVSSSIGFIGKLFLGVAAFIYFLIDMDKIRAGIRNFFKKRSKKTYFFVKTLDNEMKNYLSGLVQVMVISIFEYGIVYLLIGHPNAIMLGFMAGIANLIPYFGGILNNIIAAITAFIVSPALFVRTLIAFFILSTVDSYVINPHVYGKTNSMPPLYIIFSLSACSALFGIIGVFMSFPIAILIKCLFQFYGSNIADGIEKIKESNKKEASI